MLTLSLNHVGHFGANCEMHQAYSTYLDDGVSRDSAPTNIIRYKMKARKIKAIKESKSAGNLKDQQLDPEAKAYYRQVSVKQVGCHMI